MMNRSQVVPPHSKQILNDAVHVQEPLTVDRHKDFVQEPRISESTLTSLQPSGVVGAELPAPLPNRFIRHDDPSFGKQVLDIPEAEALSMVKPYSVADDVRRKAVPQIPESASCHCGIVPRGELT